MVTQLRFLRKRRCIGKLLLYLCICVLFLSVSVTQSNGDDSNDYDGLAHLNQGRDLFQRGKYSEAASHFWQAILSHSSSVESGKADYSVHDALLLFVESYAVQGKRIESFLFIARESFLRRQYDIATVYVNHALSLDPNHSEALEMQQALESVATITDSSSDKNSKSSNIEKAIKLYNHGLQHFERKHFDKAAKVFDQACALAQGYMELAPACTNAVYCRANIMDWGYNGTQFVKDMKLITQITQREIDAWRVILDRGKVDWKKATSVHPHMMLGYPDIDPKLKRYVAESFAINDERYARIDSSSIKIKDLPAYLPYNHTLRRQEFLLDASDPQFKIRIGFVSSGFNSKAVLYLAHDIFRFFDPDKFEIHIFSLGSPDHPSFIEYAMRGVDWRERVKSNVDFFHDVQALRDNHVALAQFIYDRKIHILIEWDGYAREGLRSKGLFALKPAPILILHQEFLGTTGGSYVDYIVTDPVASPLHSENLYTEKFLYLPHHFFVKGHAVQAEIQPPSFEFSPHQVPYALGTGDPQSNRCLASNNVGPRSVSFVYCNFNKFLKYNPDTVRSWVEILRRVPDSILCLLENPDSGVPYLRSFIQDVADISGHDGTELNNRIHFLKWEANPFDHQRRNRDFCNIILDSHPYNGHTTAQDALYAGVPIVTRSDGLEMSSRVTTSANYVLGLAELNADGIKQMVEIATNLGNNKTYFDDVRRRLITTCLQRDPYHPYWDTCRYTRNLETGFDMVWRRYLNNDEKEHVAVIEGQEEKGSSVAEIKRSDEARRAQKCKRGNKDEL